MPRQGKPMLPFGAKPLFRSPKYLEAVREMPCAITGQLADSNESVVPAHIGTAGTGIKTHDYHVTPLRHFLHMEEHAGWVTFWLKQLTDKSLLKEVLRAWAVVRYLMWKTGAQTPDELIRLVNGDLK